MKIKRGIILTLESRGSIALRLWLLVANIRTVELVERKDNLNARCTLAGQARVLQHKQRVDLVHIANPVPHDGGNSDGFVHAEIQCLNRHSLMVLYLFDDKADQLSQRRVLGNSDSRVLFC